MQELINSIQPYLAYCLPPLIGAFIGYLTNRIAIRMLFRPLKPWKISGFRIPMTPGVIPSKRHEFAVNMGEMVGKHLLTSEEIGKSLKKGTFQDHLLQLIKKQIQKIVAKDLGPLPAIIPQQFRNHFDIALTTVKYRIKENVTGFIQSNEFEQKLENHLRKAIEQFFQQDFCSIITPENRQALSDLVDSKVTTIAQSEQVRIFIEGFITKKIYLTLQLGNSLADIFPSSIQFIVVQTVKTQVPELLEKLAEMTTTPLVRNKIVEGVKEGIAGFTHELGPMAAMVNNFLTEEMVEKKVMEYLISKEDDIKAGIQQDKIQEKVASILCKKTEQFLNEPIVNYLAANSEEMVDQLCKKLTNTFVRNLNDEETCAAISLLIKNSFDQYLDNNPSTETVIADLVGTERLQSGKDWLVKELIKLFRSKNSIKILGAVFDQIIDEFMTRPIGQLSRILPGKVADGMCLSLRNLTSEMLVSEVPGLVQSLNLEKIVTEKIDSLDLLKLEKLLLSIMEEQFKYINLFGALLGFIIGCCNLLIIYLMSAIH